MVSASTTLTHSPTAAPLPSAPVRWLPASAGPHGAAQPGGPGVLPPPPAAPGLGQSCSDSPSPDTSPCQPSSTFPNPSRMHPHEDRPPKPAPAPVLLGDAWQHPAPSDVPPGLGVFLIPSVPKLIPRHSHFPNKLKPYHNAPTRRSSVRLQPVAAQRYVRLSHGAAAAPTPRCRQHPLQQWVPQAPLHPITPWWPPVGPQPAWAAGKGTFGGRQWWHCHTGTWQQECGCHPQNRAGVGAARHPLGWHTVLGWLGSDGQG